MIKILTSQLINFTSDNRNATVDMKQYRFSTPVKEYVQTNGIIFGYMVTQYGIIPIKNS